MLRILILRISLQTEKAKNI